MVSGRRHATSHQSSCGTAQRTGAHRDARSSGAALDDRLTIKTEGYVGERFEPSRVDHFATALTPTIPATVKPLDSGSYLALQRAVILHHRLVALVFCQRGCLVVLLARDSCAV